MPASVSTDIHATDTFQLRWFRHVRVFVRQGAPAFDAFSAQVLPATSNLNNTSVSCVALLLAACLPPLPLQDLIQDMKLG